MAKWATPEDKNIHYLESRYMYESRRVVYIANEETNQTWDESDIPDVIRAWENNWSTSEIAEYLGADRKEMELLLLDLIHKGKIQGNIHIFKPKRKGASKLIESIIKKDTNDIRVIKTGNESWLCLKDIWRWIGKPEHTYRKVTESWGPELRAKFKMETPGGPQNFIFINIQGLAKLCQRVEKVQKELLVELMGEVADGLGTQYIQQGTADEERKKSTKKKRQGRISRKG